MNKYIVLTLCLFVISCKSKKNTSDFNIDTSVSAKEVVERYIHQNKLDFETLHIKGNTNVSFFSVNLDIRIKKDEIILITAKAPIVGNVAKIKITPYYISYYSNYYKEFFQGDYGFLSDWLGAELDFQKAQNLILGRTLDDLDSGKFEVGIEENLYQLSLKKNDLNTTYFFEPERFTLIKQSVEQTEQNRSASVEYSNHKINNNSILPYFIVIFSNTENDKNEFKITYKTIDFNTDISFPYEIPTGYEEIKID